MRASFGKRLRALFTPGPTARTPFTRERRLRAGLTLTGDVAACERDTLDRGILDLPLPPALFLPLLDHRRETRHARVRVGERVRRGQVLADGVLASADGTVTAIGPHPIAHPSGLAVPCVTLATDPTERAASSATSTSVPPPLPPLEWLCEARLRESGLSGLGGAGFPTAAKVDAARAGAVHTLLVNGAECEPGLSCDEVLMETAAGEIVAGAVALATLLGCRRCVFAIEADKRLAGEALKSALATPDTRAHVRAPRTELIEVAPIYPSGAEPLLVALALDIHVPPGERPTAHGVLCVNVATARAAHRARLGEPLSSRVVTIGGARASAPGNVRVTFGTPLAHVLSASGQATVATDTRLRIGGPLSGFDVSDPQVPVTATVNRVALEPPLPAAPVLPCIRCAACSTVCPVALLPQELLRHARADDAHGLERGHLDACLECGCCDAVCPSNIALTATFRHARDRRRDTLAQERQAAEAKRRYRRRQERLRRATHARDVAATPVHEALDERAVVDSPSSPPPNASDPVALALERTRQRRRRRGGRERG